MKTPSVRTFPPLPESAVDSLAQGLSGEQRESLRGFLQGAERLAAHSIAKGIAAVEREGARSGVVSATNGCGEAGGGRPFEELLGLLLPLLDEGSPSSFCAAMGDLRSVASATGLEEVLDDAGERFQCQHIGLPKVLAPRLRSIRDSAGAASSAPGATGDPGLLRELAETRLGLGADTGSPGPLQDPIAEMTLHLLAGEAVVAVQQLAAVVERFCAHPGTSG